MEELQTSPEYYAWEYNLLQQVESKLEEITKDAVLLVDITQAGSVESLLNIRQILINNL